MIYKNKLGTFEFEDDAQLSHIKLVADTVMGQYFNPKRGEPFLTDEASCYDFMRAHESHVLREVGFELYINENVRRAPHVSAQQWFQEWMEKLQDEKDKREEFLRGWLTDMKKRFDLEIIA